MKRRRRLNKKFGFKSLCGIMSALVIGNLLSGATISDDKSWNKAIEDTDSWEVYKDISWSRTPDIAGYEKVVGSPTGGFVDTREQVGGKANVNSFDTNYWNINTNTSGVTTYTLNKDNGQKGILGTTRLFAWANSNNTKKGKIVLDYNTITNILEPTQTKDVWDGKTDSYYSADRINAYKNQNGINITDRIPSDAKYTDFASWYYYRPAYNNNYVNGIYQDTVGIGDMRQGDQFRLIRGDFSLTQDDIDNYDYYLGVGTENPQLILPIDDTVILMVNEQNTGINYTTAPEGVGQSLYMQTSSGIQEMTFKGVNSYYDWSAEGGLAQTCTDSEHMKLCGHTDGLHVHLSDVRDGRILSDITPYIKAKGAGNQKIDIFCSDYNKSGGITKLEVIRVKKPNAQVTKEAYVNDNLVSSSTSKQGIASIEGYAAPTQDIYYKLTYINNDATGVKNIEFTDSMFNLKLNSSKATIDGSDVSLSDFKITSYDSNGTILNSGSKALSETLTKGQYVVVESTKYLVHSVVAAESNTILSNTVKVNATYSTDSKVEEETTVKVNIQDPKISIVKKAYNSQGNEITSCNLGDTIYYGFTMKNEGNINLDDVKFDDDKLSVSLTKDGLKKNGAIVPTTSLEIYKFDASGNEIDKSLSALDKLKSLNVGECLTIKDSVNLTYTPTTIGKFKNVVVCQGGYGTTSEDKEDENSVDVISPGLKIVKQAIDFDTDNVISSNSSKDGEKNFTGSIYSGADVYYKIIVTNDGDSKIDDIKVKDTKFKVAIDKNSYEVNGSAKDTLYAEKYDASGNLLVAYDGTNLNDIFESLDVNQKIVIYDKTVLKEKVTVESNQTESKVTNTASVGGTDLTGKDIPEKDTTVKVKVKESKLEVKKEAFRDKTLVSLGKSNGDLVTGKVYSGDNIWYRLTVTNNSDSAMKDVTINDTTLGINITSSGMTVNGKSVDSSSLQITKYDSTGAINSGFAALTKLNSGEWIEVLDSSYLIKNVTSTDNDVIENIVIGSAKLNNDEEVNGQAKVEMNVSNPNIEVIKESYVDDKMVSRNSSKDEIKNITGSAFVNDTLSYKLKMTNNGDVNLKDVVMNDITLGITIDKNEMLDINQKPINSTTLKVTKYDKDGNLISTGGLELLSSLKINETIVVEDSTNLKVDLTDSMVGQTVVNKVESNATVPGNNKKVKDDATVSTQVIEDKDVRIDKYITKVTREDGTVVYNAAVNSDSIIPRIYPGDKIEFGFTITNKGKMNLTNLSLDDSITFKEKNTVIDNGIITNFKNLDGTNFNAKGFNLSAGETIKIVCTEWTVPNDARYILDNTVKLMQGKDELAEDIEEFIVYPRVYVNMVCPDDPKQEFYVTVTGDDGYKTAVTLKHGEKIELLDLDFGVNYTVTETIPMDVTLDGMDVNNGDKIHNNLVFDIKAPSNPINITIYNSKKDSMNFQSDSKVTNTIKYTNN